MNTTVDNPTPEAEVIDNRSTLGQLGKAIRQSMIYFALATIILIIAYALMINKENEVQNIFKQLVAANQVEIDVLKMHEEEIYFSKTAEQSRVSEWQKKYKDAVKTIDIMLSSPGITPEETKAIKNIKKNIGIYKAAFDKAVAASEKRGFADISGAKGDLRKAGLGIRAELDKITSDKHLEAALAKARGEAKDFIILEKSAYVKNLHKAFDHFREVAQQNPELNFESKEKLINYANKYQAAFDVYAEATFEANAAFEISETTVAAVISPLPPLIQELDEREEAAIQQVYTILIVTAIILIGIFLLVVFQLRRAQAGANQTFARR